MDIESVCFSKDFLRMLEDKVIIDIITANMSEKDAEKAIALLRAFSKRGVPAKVVMEALCEAKMNEGE